MIEVEICTQMLEETKEEMHNHCTPVTRTIYHNGINFTISQFKKKSSENDLDSLVGCKVLCFYVH